MRFQIKLELGLGFRVRADEITPVTLELTTVFFNFVERRW